MEKIAVENKVTSGSPFSRGAQHEAKRAAILSRAAKLFNTKGARSTTLADVADKLGLTKTSLYYYVKTKAAQHPMLNSVHIAILTLLRRASLPLQ